MAKISLWTAHKQRTGYNGLAKEAELSVSGNFYVRERPSKDDTLYLSRVYSPSCYSLIDIPFAAEFATFEIVCVRKWRRCS